MENDNQHIDTPGLLPRIFAGEATPEEVRQVEYWLAADPAHRSEYDTVARLWELTGKIEKDGDIDIDAEWRRMELDITPARSLPLIPFLKVAASVILVSALAFTGIKIARNRTERAPSADLSSVTLPDGTLLSLNAGSKVTYRKGFGTSHRNLLLKGEGYFEVKSDKRLPFVIEAGESRIRVTGTKFNVNAYHRKEIRVTVMAGSVSLYDASRPSNQETLSAGETGIYNRDGREIIKKVSVNLNDISWKNRIMDFQNTALSEIAGVLMNTFYGKIDVVPVVGLCPVTVHFENQDLDAVLSVLKSTLNLDLERKGRLIAISGKGC